MTEDYELLKAVNCRLNGEIGLMQLEINALRNQRDNALEMIEKMKRCANCKYHKGSIFCEYNKQHDDKCYEYEKWELEE